MPRLKSKTKRTSKLQAHAYDQEVEAYKAACEKLGLEPSETLRGLAAALVEHAEEYGHIVMPIRFANQGDRQ